MHWPKSLVYSFDEGFGLGFWLGVDWPSAAQFYDDGSAMIERFFWSGCLILWIRSSHLPMLNLRL